MGKRGGRGGIVEEVEPEGVSERRARFASFVTRVEAFYLSALRIILLLLATVLIACALWFGIAGLYNVSRNAASVKVEPANVTAAEVADIPTTSSDNAATDGKRADPLKEQRAYYKQFVDSYYGLFANRYLPYRQPDDAVPDRAAFDERFVRSADRLAALSNGDIDFATDKADLDGLLKSMRDVTDLPATADRLKRYKSAKKNRVSRVVRGMRSERYCSYFGYYINECISYSTRNVPYERTVTDVQLPKGLMPPANLLHAYQDRHFELLTTRRRDSADKADAARADILIGNARGAVSLWQGLLLIGGFLAVMFLFLLIAIERHQRRLAAEAPSVLSDTA